MSTHFCLWSAALAAAPTAKPAARMGAEMFLELEDERARPVGDDGMTETVDERLREALHDIRQPLAAVFALAECARSTPGLPDEAGRYLELLITQVDETARVARTVLDPVGVPTSDVVCFGEVVSSVLESFELTWSGRLIRSGFRGSVPVRGSWTTLRRCLVNLLDNATHAAGPRGTVLVTLDLRPDRVRLLVEDDGPGFGRVVPRSGLGLKGIRRALAAMDGSLSVGRSEVHNGACVVLSLPLVTPITPSARVS
jgi:signal transduction histidine kinase